MFGARNLTKFLIFCAFVWSTNKVSAVDPISLSKEALQVKIREMLASEIQAGRIFLSVDSQQASIAQTLNGIPQTEHATLLRAINAQVTTQIADVVVQRLMERDASIFHSGSTQIAMSSLPFFQNVKDYFQKQYGETFDGDVLIVRTNPNGWARITGRSGSNFSEAGITFDHGMLAPRHSEIASLIKLQVKTPGGATIPVTLRFFGFNQLLRSAQKYFYGYSDILYVGPETNFLKPIEQASLLHETRHLIDIEKKDCGVTNCNEFEQLEAAEINAAKSKFIQEITNSRTVRDYKKSVAEKFAARIGKSVNEAQRILESHKVFESLIEAQWNYYADRQRLIERRAEFDEIHFLKGVHGFTPEQIVEAKAKFGIAVRLEISPGNVFEIPGMPPVQLQKHELDLYKLR